MMNTTNPTVPVINVDFLRSGAEFRDAVPISVSGKRVRQDEETAGKSRNRRLDDFYNKTLQAFKPADLDAWDGLPCTRRPAPSEAGPAVTGINVDFLRSGAEFNTVDMTTSKATDEAKSSTAVPSPRTTRNKRLEEFYQKGLEAAAKSKNTGANTTHAPTTQTDTTVLNVDFLRSGAEFKPSPGTERRGLDNATTAVPSPRSSRNARLEAFYKKSAAPHANLDAWDGMTQKAK